jgi:hypothetical protein
MNLEFISISLLVELIGQNYDKSSNYPPYCFYLSSTGIYLSNYLKFVILIQYFYKFNCFITCSVNWVLFICGVTFDHKLEYAPGIINNLLSL